MTLSTESTRAGTAQNRPHAAAPSPTLTAAWSNSEAEVRAAQALRYAVFAGELGARLPPESVACRRDIDRFDPWCEHLLVWAGDAQDGGERTLVGTYRVLPPDAARRLGGLYADQEFDLSALAPLRARMIELGRACVHPAWRSGGVILALWSALGRYMVERDFDTMVGCASVGLADGGEFASRLWYALRAGHLAPPQWRATPHTALALHPPSEARSPLTLRAMPPLIKGYLRGGATVLGAPAYDAGFHTADLPIMMRLQDLSDRYRKQFLLP
jgi:putative hemolysin